MPKTEVRRSGYVLPVRVFLSHSQADIDVVRRISTEFVRANVKVWYDTMKLVPGDELSPAIFEAIDLAEVFVILVSPGSLRSTWVQRELEHALTLEARGDLHVVPLRLDGSEPFPALSDRVWIDLDSSDPDHGIGELLSRVRANTKPLAAGGRASDPDVRTFTDYAIETRRSANDRLIVRVDVVSIDLEERYSILSEFEFESSPDHHAPVEDLEQAERLISACADSYERKPGRALLGSGDVHRFQSEVIDGGLAFVMRGRVRRVGRASRGVVLFNVGALFSIIDGRST